MAGINLRKCCCGPAEYRPARYCSNNELASLWVPISAIAAYPYFFSYSGGCYYVTDADPTTTSPGTIATPRTAKTSCTDCNSPGSKCGYCDTTGPAAFTISFTGVTTCTDCYQDPAGCFDWIKPSGSPNGTYSCLLVQAADGCSWRGHIYTVTYERWVDTNGGCTGTDPDVNGYRISTDTLIVLNANADGTMTLTAQNAASACGALAEAWFSKTITVSGNCNASHTFTNAITTGCSSTVLADRSMLYGGSATVTPCT